MDTADGLNATEGDRATVERRRLRLCIAAACLVPAIAACASFGILRLAWLIGGPRMMMSAAGQTFWRIYENGVLPANAIIGAAIVAAAVIRLHPGPGGRVRIAVGWGLASLIVYVIAYAALEAIWNTVMR